MVCYRIVENVNMKAYVQATRHLVYVLFDSLIANHRNGAFCILLPILGLGLVADSTH